jgi:hypothetical protein
MPSKDTQNIIDLVRHITGQEQVSYVAQSQGSWILRTHEVLVGERSEPSFLIRSPQGEFVFYETRQDFDADKVAYSGHIEDTPVGTGQKQKLETLVKNVTGHDIKHGGWIDFSGLLRGSVYYPDEEKENHAFFLIEGPGENRVTIFQGETPGNPDGTGFDIRDIDDHTFQEGAFWAGAADRFDDPAVSISCKMSISNRDVFLDMIGITGLDTMDAANLMKIVSMPEYPTRLGLNGVGVGDISVEGDTIAFSLTASVADWARMAREVRDHYAQCHGDRNWYPSSPEEALFELGLGSAISKGSDLTGFELSGWEVVTVEDPSPSAEDGPEI